MAGRSSALRPDGPERVSQLLIEGLRSEFPPLWTVDQQIPLAGTVTIVLAEGRRMMRLSRELTADQFGALLRQYQSLLRSLLEKMGGREVEVSADTAVAAFPTAKQAALAAVAAQRAVAAHEWPHGLRPAMSVPLHSGEAGIGWVGPASLLCDQIVDAAEGGQIFTRRTHEKVRVHELVAPESRG